MTSLLKILAVILIAAVSSYAVVQHMTAPAAVAEKETAFQRVLRTNTIRCGYYVYPPVTYRDPNTGKLSGFTVDMMEDIAAKAGLVIEWTQEVHFGNWQMDLDAGRFDVACTPNWPTTALGRMVLFSKPMFYAKIHAIGRAGDDRFKTLADVNRPEVKISIHEGNEIYHLAKEMLPNATLLTLPPNAEGMQTNMDVVSGKADLMISDGNAPAQWNPNNEQKIAITAGGETLKLMAFDLAVAAGENDLMNFLNNAIDDLHATGRMENMLNKWMTHKGVYLMPASPAAAQ